jgi:hypothetical protein
MIESHHRLGRRSGGGDDFPKGNLSRVTTHDHQLFHNILLGNESVFVLERRLNEILNFLDVEVTIKKK